MAATNGAATSRSRHGLTTTTYRRLLGMGFADAEAANLTALAHGFEIGSQPWTIGQLTRLLFLRALAHTRGEWSGTDDRAPAQVDAAWRVPGRTPRYLDHPDGRISVQSLFQATAGSDANRGRLTPDTSSPLNPSPDARREQG